MTTRWRKRMGERDQVGVEFTSDRAGLEGIVPDPRAKGGKGSRPVASAR